MSEIISTGEVADYIKTHLNTPRLGMLINSFKKTLNKREDRFPKANAIHIGIELYSSNTIMYVNRPGCDHIIPELNDATIEVKFAANTIFSTTGSMYPNVSVKLFNSNGTKRDCLPDTYAKHLLCVSNRGCLLISIEALKPYLYYKDDGIVATFPTKLGTVIADVSMDIPYTPEVSLVEKIDDITREYVGGIPETPPPVDNLDAFLE